MFTFNKIYYYRYYYSE